MSELKRYTAWELEGDSMQQDREIYLCDDVDTRINELEGLLLELLRDIERWSSPDEIDAYLDRVRKALQEVK